MSQLFIITKQITVGQKLCQHPEFPEFIKLLLIITAIFQFKVLIAVLDQMRYTLKDEGLYMSELISHMPPLELACTQVSTTLMPQVV
jgi:hypothetical protein